MTSSLLLGVSLCRVARTSRRLVWS